jgi:hypothetical protein
MLSLSPIEVEQPQRTRRWREKKINDGKRRTKQKEKKLNYNNDQGHPNMYSEEVLYVFLLSVYMMRV